MKKQTNNKIKTKTKPTKKKKKKTGLVFTSFISSPSLSSVIADNRKQFQSLDIDLNNSTVVIIFGTNSNARRHVLVNIVNNAILNNSRDALKI